MTKRKEVENKTIQTLRHTWEEIGWEVQQAHDKDTLYAEDVRRAVSDAFNPDEEDVAKYWAGTNKAKKIWLLLKAFPQTVLYGR